MFDPSSMYPKGYHPVRLDKSLDFQGKARRHTRTDSERPPRYFFTSFGLARRYPSRDVLDKPRRDSDSSAHDRRHRRLCNPFHADVYDLGKVIRACFMEVRIVRRISFLHHRPRGDGIVLQKYHGFEFMQELVDAMTTKVSEHRPSIEEVVERFANISASLSTSKLRSAITLKDDPVLVSAFKRARQSIRTLSYVVHRRAAIPLP